MIWDRPEFQNPHECPVCLSPFNTVYGCREDRLIRFADGAEMEPVRYGEEGAYQDFGEEVPVDPCEQCGAMPGHYHHLGCEYEDCPRCGEAYITCSCSTAEKFRIANLRRSSRRGRR